MKLCHILFVSRINLNVFCSTQKTSDAFFFFLRITIYENIEGAAHKVAYGGNYELNLQLFLVFYGSSQ